MKLTQDNLAQINPVHLATYLKLKLTKPKLIYPNLTWRKWI